jgi:putative molybdopterin biosynthesis protein
MSNIINLIRQHKRYSDVGVIYLDGALHREGISTVQIQGYAVQEMNHTEVARAVAKDKADVGLGLGAAACIYGLDFIPLTL